MSEGDGAERTPCEMPWHEASDPGHEALLAAAAEAFALRRTFVSVGGKPADCVVVFDVLACGGEDVFEAEVQAAIRGGSLCIRGSKENVTNAIFLGRSPPMPAGHEGHDGPVVYTVMGRSACVRVVSAEDPRDAC